MPGGVSEEVSGRVPEMGGQYPEFHLFDPLPCWGLYLRHIDGVRCDGVRMSCREPDARPVTAWEDAGNIDCGEPKASAMTAGEETRNAACGEPEASAMTAEKATRDAFRGEPGAGIMAAEEDEGNAACQEPDAGTEREDVGNVCE